MARWIGCAFAVLFAVALVAQDRDTQARAKLVGLETREVEARIGPPNEKEELADSNEAYWIYKTKAGTLAVHFQNGLVVDIDPANFPVESILK